MDNRKVIYLDEAIEAVSEACFELRGVFERCEDALKALPPAEPEIIHCKDCRYRELDDHYGFMCGLDTGDPYGLGRCADDENWYCADAERRED